MQTNNWKNLTHSNKIPSLGSLVRPCGGLLRRLWCGLYIAVHCCCLDAPGLLWSLDAISEISINRSHITQQEISLLQQVCNNHLGGQYLDLDCKPKMRIIVLSIDISTVTQAEQHKSGQSLHMYIIHFVINRMV